MSFYTHMSRYYDEIFPVDHTDLDFWTARFSACLNILDVGCGTGNKTVFFARPDNRITGIDLDLGMIKTAWTENQRNNIRYQVLGMALIDREFEPGSFDGILCLGNSLVHLKDQPALDAQLARMSRLLKPGGLCLIQILNYDRILDQKIMTLPLIETDNVVFSRAYEPDGENLLFKTTLTVKDGGESWVNNDPLYPIRKGELEAGLARAGFNPPENFGTYQGGPFTQDSMLLMSLSTKK